MKYEKTPVKPMELNPRRKFNFKEAKDITEISTARLLWFVVIRHKFGLLLAYATVMTVTAFIQWLIV